MTEHRRGVARVSFTSLGQVHVEELTASAFPAFAAQVLQDTQDYVRAGGARPASTIPFLAADFTHMGPYAAVQEEAIADRFLRDVRRWTVQGGAWISTCQLVAGGGGIPAAVGEDRVRVDVYDGNITVPHVRGASSPIVMWIEWEPTND